MEVGDSLNSNSKICCPCGNSLPTEFMIQCVDPRCLVQQHTTCVIIPENSMEEILPMLPFFCEMCRIKRADPRDCLLDALRIDLVHDEINDNLFAGL
ncbi:hypothetical protein Q3G72_029235 [Acer saccharum]|nr:hypothetical protein Q3G72_029235 [Acer saccharum]